VLKYPQCLLGLPASAARMTFRALPGLLLYLP